MTELSKEKVLLNVKEDLNIPVSDTLQDTVLNRLIEKVVSHFEFDYGDKPKEKHSFIIEDCTIRRFNRRQAEGATSVSVEGHSVTYLDKHEFSEWDDRLRKEFNVDGAHKVKQGGVYFR